MIVLFHASLLTSSHLRHIAVTKMVHETGKLHHAPVPPVVLCWFCQQDPRGLKQQAANALRACRKAPSVNFDTTCCSSPHTPKVSSGYSGSFPLD